jgi:hypothetical protein
MPVTLLSAGKDAVLKFGTVIVPASNWKLSVDAKLRDAANFADGRNQIGTLPDADFSTSMFWDTLNMPHDPAGFNLVPGAKITARCYVDQTHFLSVPITVSKIDMESKVDDIVTYNVDGKQSGAIIWPTIP